MWDSHSFLRDRQGIFFSHLLHWSLGVERSMPWKATQQPYHIWISEIILQQTQVKQAIPYYLHFIQTFPSVDALADANIDAVLKAWHGLGYYSRARNLHAAAKIMQEAHHSKVPDDFSSLKQLPGIGEYTAGAIMSFAYHQPYAAIDSNVIRLVSRYVGIIEAPTSKTLIARIKAFITPAYAWCDPAAVNQALIDFGATVCTAQNPDCDNCPFSEDCYAKVHSMVTELPIKKPLKTRRLRYFHYFLFTDGKDIILTQRSETDIWKGLMELPAKEYLTLSEYGQNTLDTICNTVMGKSSETVEITKIEEKKQILTHQIIQCKIFFCTIEKILQIKQPYFLADRQKVSTFAFPKIITDTINLWIKTG